MPQLPAYRFGQPIGWVRIPERQGFGWILRLPTSERTSVSAPVRVQTKDRGWTQFFYVELDGLTAWQLDQLMAQRLLEIAAPANDQHAASAAA
jgi:hypothetical protein